MVKVEKKSKNDGILSSVTIVELIGIPQGIVLMRLSCAGQESLLVIVERIKQNQLEQSRGRK